MPQVGHVYEFDRIILRIAYKETYDLAICHPLRRLIFDTMACIPTGSVDTMPAADTSTSTGSHLRAVRALSPEQRLERHKVLLRESKLRVTSVRLAILRVLEDSHEAMTAQQMFERVAAAGAAPGRKSSKPGRKGDAGGESDGGAPDRVTVYRTLNSLVESGIAHRVDPGDRVFRFSMTDHAKCTEHHHVHEHPHFVCDSCGKVQCLQGAEVVIKTQDEDTARTARWRVKQQDVVLHGTCDACSESGGKASR